MQDGSNYIYTLHSDVSITKLVRTHYLSTGTVRCRFYVSGLHDNYLIEHSGRNYMLRVYRSDWRSNEEIQFELELLDFLQCNRAAVAGPVSTVDGSLSVTMDSPEGSRSAALFHYAHGRAPEAAITAQECELLGRTVAEVHQMGNMFATTRQRPELDFLHLVEEPVALYAPYLDTDTRRYLQGLQLRLRQEWPNLERVSGVYGICTGDINTRNFHITDKNQITLFDFDQCGFGYRAFELAKFASSIHFHDNKQQLFHAFVKGYQQIRKVSKDELEAIAIYEMAAVIWVLGITAKNVNRIGLKYMEKPYWGRKIEILKALEKK